MHQSALTELTTKHHTSAFEHLDAQRYGSVPSLLIVFREAPLSQKLLSSISRTSRHKEQKDCSGTMAPNTETTAEPLSNKSGGGMKSTLSFGTLMHAAFDDDDEGHEQSHPGLSKDAVNMVMDTVQKHFPKALNAHTLAFQLKDNLAHFGFTENNVLLGTALCSDDVNRDLEDELRKIFDNNHSMGGLSGFCFAGASAFGNMLHHVPEQGHVLVVYGPHVGIDWEGNVGKVNRRGQTHPSACCASAKAAATYVRMVHQDERVEPSSQAPASLVDSQQEWVQRQLLPHAARLAEAAEPDVELAHALLDCQEKLMNDIIQMACSKLRNEYSKIALVGGVQVNTPEGTAEYFLPTRSDLLNHKGELIEDLLPDFHNSIANTATW